MLEGTVNIDVGDQNLTLHENDIAVINEEELHRIVKNPAEAANKLLFIQIDSAFYRRLLPEHSYVFLYCCSAYHEETVPHKYERLREYIALLISALTENPCGEYKRNIENILTAMLDYLTYNFDYLRWGFGTAPFDERLVNRLKQIAGHTISGIDVMLKLKELADEAGISLQHLSQDIKKKFGYTFLELLYYSRCEKAARLLLSTDKRVIDIAMECGFSDTKYFVKYFRQYFHAYPSEFRKTHHADIPTLSSQAEYCDYPLSCALDFK